MASLRIENYYKSLLHQTLENARRKPLYVELWGSSVASCDTPLTISDIPVIGRQEFFNAVSGREHEDAVVLIHHTTGTTSESLFRHRTQKEIAYLAQFFTRLLHKTQPSGPRGLRPIILNETDAFHGTPIPIPTDAIPVHAQAADPVTLDQTILTLTRSYRIAGATDRPVAIVGTEEFILIITLELIKRGIDPRTLGIRRLMTRGHYLSNERRRFIERIWGICISDFFSLSEVFGTARRTGSSGRYRFEPTVFAEFLDPHTLSPVHNGIAELVLTELAPFVTYEPLIRYRTGDLVEVFSDETFPSLSEFVPLGRVSRSIWDEECQPASLLLGQYDLIEVVDAFPEIAREETKSWIARRFGHIPLGRPHVAFETSGKSVNVVAELTYSVDIFHEAASSFCNEMAARVSNLLSRACGSRADAYNVSVSAGKGTVTPSPIFVR